MSEDMSNLMNQINNMMKSGEMPDEIKNMVNQLTNHSQNSNEDKDSSKTSSNVSSVQSENNALPEFDMATMMKIKKMMDSMKESRDDPRANLLKSLKPYLKESRKEKVDQYIRSFWNGKSI